jgi:hypothetical protein
MYLKTVAARKPRLFCEEAWDKPAKVGQERAAKTMLRKASGSRAVVSGEIAIKKGALQ